MMLRLGPYGDAFGAKPDGLTLDGSRPHRTASTSVRCSPGCPKCSEHHAAESNSRPSRWSPTRRGFATRSAGGADGFVLIGRRHLRSNNSWMHNVPALAGGTNRCTLQIHPDDAADLGLDRHREGQGPGGELLAPVEPMPGMRRGVVSLPHGWGHDRGGTRQGVAAGAARRQRQPAQRRQSARSAVGHGRAQRHPGRYRPRGLRSAPRSPSPRSRRSAGPARAARPPWPPAASAPAVGVGGVVPADSEIEMTLPRVSPDNWAYCSARSLASSKARVAGVLDQLRVVLDRVADGVDAGGVAAGGADQRQRLRRGVQLADLDVDRVARLVADDRRVVAAAVLRLQGHVGRADVACGRCRSSPAR